MPPTPYPSQCLAPLGACTRLDELVRSYRTEAGRESFLLSFMIPAMADWPAEQRIMYSPVKAYRTKTYVRKVARSQTGMVGNSRTTLSMADVAWACRISHVIDTRKRDVDGDARGDQIIHQEIVGVKRSGVSISKVPQLNCSSDSASPK